MLKKIAWLIRGFLALVDFRKWGFFHDIFRETRFDASINPSWSQYGEDISIAPFLSDAELNKFYIDVGAHDPNRFSVTRKLYAQGWSGIDVDGNPTYEAKFRKLRPRNRFINACIGSLKSYEFTIFTEGAISSVNKSWVDKFQSEGAVVKEVVKIPGMTLRELINLPNVPETVGFINIDIEGADEDALRSLELETLPIKRFPKWLLLETTPPVQSALVFPAVQYAVSHGYVPWLVLPMATLLKAPQIKG